MSKTSSLKKIVKNVFSPVVLVTALIVFFIIMLVVNPEVYLKSSLNGITVFAITVLPGLLPFFFLTKLLTSLNVVDKLALKITPVSHFLFGTSGISSYIFLISILCGYPMGAKLTADFVNAKKIDASEAKKIITFTSNSGPLFIIGTVGISMLHSKLLGLIILVSHIIGSLLNGIFFNLISKFKKDKNKKLQISTLNLDKKIEYNKLLNNGMSNTISSVFMVGGFIAIFYLCIDILLTTGALNLFILGGEKLFGILNIPPEFSKGLITGIIEVTRGCLDIGNLTTSAPVVACVLSSLIISFGGFSVGAQAMFFLKDANISFGFYLMQKITHALFTCVICIILCLIFV